MCDSYDLSPGWTRLPLRTLLRRRKERATGKELLLSVTQTRGVIRQEEVGRRDSSNDDKSSYWRVQQNDIVYNTMRMWQGVSGRSNFQGIVSPAYTVCEPIGEVETRFLAYLFKSPKSISNFYRLSQGLVSDTWNLRYPAFASIKFDVPPLAEQRRIADILDALHQQISAIEVVIGNLRSSHHGLSESLMRSAEAETMPLSSHLTRPPKNGYSPKEVDEWTGLVALGLGCLTHEGFQPRQLKNVPARDGRNASAMVNDGDLLMSRANTRELVGLAGVYRDVGMPCIYPDLMMKLTPLPTCRTEYLELHLRSDDIRRRIQAIAQGTSESMGKISGSEVQRLPVAIPSLAEQDRILKIVNTSQEGIELRKRERDKLALLEQGLAEDLLTGRVRVETAESVLEDL
ncbi:restriction endonuclease subunit S [Nonomuraea sp. B1E8]|uniref:restriction endonuclease subunit S n=1 Tax=unclassified Nonomuraea TaxID=2593643 RepID=UPI00325EEAAF